MFDSKISKVKKTENFDLKIENFINKFFLFFVFILPILFLPVYISSLAASKMFLVYFFVFIVGTVLLFSNFKKTTLIIPWNILGLSISLILLVYVISTIFSQNVGISFWGRDFALDSTVSIAVFFALLGITVKIFKSKKDQKSIYFFLVLFLSSLIISIYHLLNIFFPTIVPDMGFFGFNIATTLGKWNDLGLFSTLIVILSIMTLDKVKLVNSVKSLLYVTLILNLVLVIIVNFGFAWYLLGIFTIIYFLCKLIEFKGGKEKTIHRTSIVILILSLAFVFFGKGIENNFFKFLNINHIEARPSVESTFEVTKEVFKNDLILGSGPATFETQWPKYRPNNILMTDFWNNDFRYGFGLIPTFISNIGILGGITWLFFLISLIIFGVKALTGKTRERDDGKQFILLSSFVGTLILWIISIFYLPSTVIFTLTFIFTGIFIASVSEMGLLKTKEIVIRKKDSPVKWIFILNILLMVSVIFVGYKLINKFIAQIYFQQTVDGLIRTANAQTVEAKIFKAAQIDPIDTHFRSIAEVNTTKLESLFISSANGEEVSQEDILEVTNTVINNYEKAINYDPYNYNNYLGLANFYKRLMQLGTNDLYDVIKDLYAKTLELKPDNPVIYLEIAHLEVLKNNNDLAREFVKKALELKPNYSDASFFLAQLEFSLNRREDALKILKNAILNSPTNPQTYFQLGLFHYNVRSFVEAVSDFEKTIILNTDFQNARYFLALSYYEIGKEKDALSQLEILKKINPLNKDIQFMIKNIQAGRDPFYGSKSTVVETGETENLPLEDSKEVILEE